MVNNSGTKRFVIYGAGAIGGVVGGHLAMAGYEVVLVGRPDPMNVVCRQGLKLITPTGAHTLRLQAVTSPSEVSFQPNDVVLLTVKGQNTEPAMRDLHDIVDDVPIFCMQNGVRNEEIVSRYFSRVYGVSVKGGAVYMNDGEVVCRSDPPARVIVGRYPAGTDALVEDVASDLRSAKYSVMVTPDVMPYKWGKLVGNLVNAVGAITNARGGEVNRIAEAGRREAAQLLREACIRWVSQKELAVEWPESAERPRAAMDTEEQSSTWQSLGRQQGTVETDFLNGEIVRIAKRLGKTAPINDRICRITQEMAANRERPGKYTPTELSLLLGLDETEKGS